MSKQASEDKRQTDLLFQAWEESGKVYSHRKLHDGLLEQGEMSCPNRVARLPVLQGSRLRSGSLDEPTCNCHDSGVVESFFNLLKRERLGRRVCRSRDEARQGVFDYRGMLYNPKRMHVRNGMLSPVEFEKQQKF